MEKRQQLEEGVVGKDAGGGAEEREQFDTLGQFTWHCGQQVESREGLARELMRSPSLLHPAGSAASWPCCSHLYLPVQDKARPGAIRPHLTGLPAAQL